MLRWKLQKRQILPVNQNLSSKQFLLAKFQLVSSKLSLAMMANDIPQDSKNKPRGLYFSTSLFEGLIFEGAYIWRGLSMERNLRFKIDWASLIVGSKFTVFALVYFVFEGNFPSTSSRGLIFGGQLNRGFFALPVWGAYIWRGLYMEGLIFGILQFTHKLPKLCSATINPDFVNHQGKTNNHCFKKW